MGRNEEGRVATPPSIWYLILVIWGACDLNLVMISSLPSKWQVLKVVMSVSSSFEGLYISLRIFSSWMIPNQNWLVDPVTNIIFLSNLTFQTDFSTQQIEKVFKLCGAGFVGEKFVISQLAFFVNNIYIWTVS